MSKCDDCVHLKGEMPSQEYPYPTTWCRCNKGKWEGNDSGADDALFEDPWKDCSDFVELESDDG